VNGHHRQESKALGKVVRALGLQSAAQRAFTVHPNVEGAAMGLVQFLTERFPGRGEPLVHECLRAAFRALSEAKAAKRDDQAQAFLVALIAGAFEAVRKRVGVENGHGPTFWVPFQESFRSFLERVAPDPESVELVVLDEPAPGAVDERMAAMMLAVRIMPAVEAERICEAYLRAAHGTPC